jgi:hypothetical protein
MVVEPPQSTRVEEPTLLCNQVPRRRESAVFFLCTSKPSKQSRHEVGMGIAPSECSTPRRFKPRVRGPSSKYGRRVAVSRACSRNPFSIASGTPSPLSRNSRLTPFAAADTTLDVPSFPARCRNQMCRVCAASYLSWISLPRWLVALAVRTALPSSPNLCKFKVQGFTPAGGLFPCRNKNWSADFVLAIDLFCQLRGP